MLSKSIFKKGRAVEGELCTHAWEQPVTDTHLSTTEAAALHHPP